MIGEQESPLKPGPRSLSRLCLSKRPPVSTVRVYTWEIMLCVVFQPEGAPRRVMHGGRAPEGWKTPHSMTSHE